MKTNDFAKPLPHSNEAEQSVLGALLLDNEALYRLQDLKSEHFYQQDHKMIFDEICKQISAGKHCDVISLFDALRGKIQDCLPYLNQLAQGIGSSASVGRYSEIVIDRAIKRELSGIGSELQAQSFETADVLLDRVAGRIEELAQKKTKKEPKRFSDMLSNYVEVIQSRMEGKIKPIQTGFKDLDARLDGGLERGTLTILAARPSMGKTAMGLCIARNASENGTALFLSMEMDEDQVSDRNIAALGRLPISWLRLPQHEQEGDKRNWDSMTHAFHKSQDLNLFIDDQTALNMLEIRNKARTIKRRHGLDVLVIDQLSFITGGKSDKSWEVVGEYTRGLLALSKELKIAVILLCQLNRECEKRNNKRPMMSDLAMSGSIEQDAANIIFLYRDEIYNMDSKDKGICEVITAKQRQGSPGVVALTYIGDQTRFEDVSRPWQQPEARDTNNYSRGFD